MSAKFLVFPAFACSLPFNASFFNFGSERISIVDFIDLL